MKPTSGDSTNLIFTAGDRSLKEMLQSLNKGVFITGFNGGNCNGSRVISHMELKLLY